MADPILSKSDLQSAVWLKVKEHLEAELAERREYNDGLSLTEVETAAIRGEIKRLKRLLKLGAENK